MHPRLTSKQLNHLMILLAVVCLLVWQGFVYYAAQHPLPAGTCVSGYGECVTASPFWGNVVWGSMGLFIILLPGWVITLTAIVVAQYISRQRKTKRRTTKSKKAARVRA